MTLESNLEEERQFYRIEAETNLKLGDFSLELKKENEAAFHFYFALACYKIAGYTNKLEICSKAIRSNFGFVDRAVFNEFLDLARTEYDLYKLEQKVDELKQKIRG